jgi:phage shock protein E
MPSFKNRPVDLVLDVRSKLEYFLGHLDGAVNIPVDQLPNGLAGRAGVTPQSRIMVYCAGGTRSAQAAAILKHAGYSNIVDGGGMAEAHANFQAA